MKGKTNSSWMAIQVELVENIYGYDKKVSKDKIGSVDYIKGRGKKKKLFRVLKYRKKQGSKSIIENVRETIETMDEEGYKEAKIIAANLTDNTKKLIIKKKNLDFITKDSRTPYSISELYYATQVMTNKLCESICGKAPKKEKDCKGYSKGKYSCMVRMISDNADFHAERRWLPILYDDFSKLLEIKRKKRKSELIRDA
jgi:hypothetical protein